MLYVPVTLPASKMFGTMTTLLNEIRNKETLAPSEIINEMVDSARIGKVDFGKGIIYNFKLAPQPNKDLTEVSSAMTITKANIGQEIIPIDDYKFVPLSYSEILGRDAFTNGTTIDSFFAFISSLCEDTAQFYLYDKVNSLYQDWVPGQATQTIQIDQIDTSGLTGQALNEAKKWNATEVGKVVRKTINNMSIKNTKFTDIATFNDINTGLESNVVSCVKKSDLKMVFNDNYYTNFLADAMASLYHADEVGQMLPGGKPVLVPTDAMKVGNEKVIGWLADKDKFALADFYAVMLEWRDPSTLYVNKFYHYATGAGIFKYAPGVKFVERTIQPGAEA